MWLAQVVETGLPHGLVISYYIAGVLVGLGVLGTLWVKWIWPMLRRIRNFLNDWEGQPARDDAGIPEQPGVMKRLHLVELDISGIKQELHPNHGGSMKDQVNRIEQAVTNGDS